MLQASAAPERPGTAPSAFSGAAGEAADARRSSSTAAIAASPFANSAFAAAAAPPPDSGRGLERASSPALGSGVTAQTVADGLPSAPSAPLTNRDGACPAGTPAAPGDAGRAASGRHASTSSPYSQEYAHHSATSSPSVSGILTALPHRGGTSRTSLSRDSIQSVSSPRELGVFASHPIPEEAAAEDEGGGRELAQPPEEHVRGKSNSKAGGVSLQAR